MELGKRPQIWSGIHDLVHNELFKMSYLSHGNMKIGIVELVRNVPAERSKLPPLLDVSVEETETEEESVPGLRLVATFVELLEC